jgi:hypothetical protein
LLSWKKNEVQDPKSGRDVGLQEYLKRIRNAGQRCNADAWDRAWARAMRQYKLSGELSDDWEKEGKAFEVEVTGKSSWMDKMIHDDVVGDNDFVPT